MNLNAVTREESLRSIPSVEEVLHSMEFEGMPAPAPRDALTSAVREVLSGIRETILSYPTEKLSEFHRTRHEWVRYIQKEAQRRLAPSLRPVINATGVIIHTNLGRSLLPAEALEALHEAASRYSNLELNLASGKRGSRYVHVGDLLCRLTGAEAAMVVNNNAAAVLISLNTIADGGEVIVSRGELVEIGGSFRMPDVMTLSGAKLVDVGTTNKTKLKDYEAAVGPDTALLLKVHTSNYRIIGFTQDVSLKDLVRLGKRHDLPVMKDLGSGCLMDLRDWQLEPEPTVQDTLRTGAHLVTFSGDKLLGGPQAGIILGRRSLIEKIRMNPLNRALRIDKLTLAALEATLRLYWDPAEAMNRIPTLRMLSVDSRSLRRRALRLAAKIRKEASQQMHVEVGPDRSQVGGGALPMLELPTWAVGLKLTGIAATRLEKALRKEAPPVIARIQKEVVRLDLRTVQETEINTLAHLVGRVCAALQASDGE